MIKEYIIFHDFRNEKLDRHELKVEKRFKTLEEAQYHLNYIRDLTSRKSKYYDEIHREKLGLLTKSEETGGVNHWFIYESLK